MSIHNPLMIRIVIAVMRQHRKARNAKRKEHNHEAAERSAEHARASIHVHFFHPGINSGEGGDRKYQIKKRPEGMSVKSKSYITMREGAKAGG